MTLGLGPHGTDTLIAHATLVPNRPWTAQAKCAGASPDLWFPEQGEHSRERDGRVAQAIAVCRTCPVQAECLDDALDRNEQYGIWGGVTTRDRKKLRRQREQGRAVA